MQSPGRHEFINFGLEFLPHVNAIIPLTMREMSTHKETLSGILLNYDSDLNSQRYNLHDVGEKTGGQSQSNRVVGFGKISNVEPPIAIQSEMMEFPRVTLRCKPPNFLKAKGIKTL